MSFGDLLFWVRSHKSSVAAIVFVVAGCMALTHLARRVHHLQPRIGAGASAVAAVDAASATGSGDGDALTPSKAQGTERGTRTARMRGEFDNATSYIDFIQQAM